MQQTIERPIDPPEPRELPDIHDRADEARDVQNDQLADVDRVDTERRQSVYHPVLTGSRRLLKHVCDTVRIHLSDRGLTSDVNVWANLLIDGKSSSIGVFSQYKSSPQAFVENLYADPRSPSFIPELDSKAAIIAANMAEERDVEQFRKEWRVKEQQRGTPPDSMFETDK